PLASPRVASGSAWISLSTSALPSPVGSGVTVNTSGVGVTVAVAEAVGVGVGGSGRPPGLGVYCRRQSEAVSVSRSDGYRSNETPCPGAGADGENAQPELPHERLSSRPPSSPISSTSSPVLLKLRLPVDHAVSLMRSGTS